MKNFALKSLTCILSLFSLLNLSAQNNFKGKLIDLTSGKNISGATVQIDGSNRATTSDEEGLFEIAIPGESAVILIQHVSYQALTLEIKKPLKSGIEHIYLTARQVGLDEINIIASYISERTTPVAISNISQRTIEREMGSQEYPEIMKMVPGVYATKLGGGTGDARISIRGFQQENLGLLLNGVPVSSVENGLVYWSNWAGLGDATQAIQVQKGLGASKVALNSVGGTINIITKTTEAAKGGTLRHMFTSYGNQKTIFSISSGLSEKGFAVTFLGSRTRGPGYVDATHVDAWAWFISASKQINNKHLLVFTGMGSPERHGQRTYGLTKQEYSDFGIKYNPNWGMYKGKINSLSENFYHKPQLSLNHYWNISDKTHLASSAYLSFGYGGGKFSESYKSPSANTFRKSNQIDWDAIYNLNKTHNDSSRLADGSVVRGFSKIIQTNYLASHIWYGGLTNLTHELENGIKITAGLHARYFKSNLREEISDLLGGKYWIDEYAWSLAGIAGRQQIKTKGDIINVDNDARVDVISMFGQAEYSFGKMNLFLAGTVSGTRYQRFDRINYINNTASEKVSKAGFDVKSGISYQLNEQHNLYLNAGYYSKAPYYKFVFANFSNAVVQDIKNESIKSAELGYTFSSSKLNVNLNAYYTLWEDKSILSRENIQLEDNSQTRALIRGLDALHKGIELEMTGKINRSLSLGGILSVGDWRWRNDVIAELYNDNQELIDLTEVYVKDLKVGDAPQFQMGLFADATILKDWNLKVNWLYFGSLYANFDPAGRNNPDDRKQPYRIPDYSNIDLFLEYEFKIGQLKTIAGISCYNLSGKESITRGEDGITHDLNSFRGFWTHGRTFSFTMAIKF